MTTPPHVDPSTSTGEISRQISPSHVDPVDTITTNMPDAQVDAQPVNSEESLEIANFQDDVQPGTIQNDMDDEEVQVDSAPDTTDDENRDDESSEDETPLVAPSPVAYLSNQQRADLNYRGKRQANTLIDRIIANWEPASIGGTVSTWTRSPRGNQSVAASNQGLIDILELQGRFVNEGVNKGGRIFKKVDRHGKALKIDVMKGKKGHKKRVRVTSTCSVIDSARDAFEAVYDLKNSEHDVDQGTKKTRAVLSSSEYEVDQGIKKTRAILKRYVDGPRKRVKGNKGKKKVQDDEDEDEGSGEDITCVGIDKTLKKDDEDDNDDPEGNGGGVFDFVPSGITA
ncbi:hypothetical protein M436DRAFT_62352 [Aureobasidium namibiae CBS 147.97]|uniref:Uncharacterized protein n=1 Tax=Aureobasidium namibiae CBS 147.97 TaxID=1043004 RepID=A0A074WTN0_9PEZI